MIFGNKSKAEDENRQRELIITYKRAFGSSEGKEVLFDLMNRFYILNGHGGDPRKEGQREAVLWILSQCNINLAEFDRLLKGDNE